MPESVVVHSQTPVAVHVKESPEPTIVSVDKPVVVLSGFGQGLPGRPGDKGDKGDKGETGDRGTDGFGALSYIHNQTMASTEWLIDHNLGTYPSVTTVDFEGNEFEGTVRYDESGNTLMVTFNVAVSGRAFLN